MTVNPVQTLENIVKNDKASNTEKINAAKALAQIAARETRGNTGSVSRMSRAEISSELRRCKALLDGKSL